MVQHFIRDESGAITVDWVVLTAGLAVLGLAVVAIVASGVRDTSSSVSSSIASVEIRTEFAGSGISSLLSDDFAGGIGNWIGGTVASVAGFGDILQIGPNETAQMTVDIPAGTSSATISFDMLGVDDLSGPGATVYIDGQPVAIYADDHGNITTTDLGVDGVSVTVDQQYTNDPMGGGSHGHDSRATYTITVDNPGSTLTFGVENGSGQPISEEFYAIDDVSVTTG